MAYIVIPYSTLPPRIQPQCFKLGLEFQESVSRRLPLSARPGFGCSRVNVRLNAASRVVRGEDPSPWDDNPYELLPGGRKVYLDEQDVVSFLDPPKELIPIDPDSYNPAAYLWKKIGDIPEERRHRLLSSVKGRLISRCWELAGMRYQDAKLAKQSSSALLAHGAKSAAPEIWNCRTSEGNRLSCLVKVCDSILQCTSSGPLPVGWLNDFKKVIFHGNDGDTYGWIIIGGPVPFSLEKFYGPLYFKVRQVMEVMSTEQPCDVAYEFGDGLLDPLKIPAHFPKPAENPWPFNDNFVIYVRHTGPGVLVAQAWQEGKELEQVPKKFCGDILMVKNFSASEQ